MSELHDRVPVILNKKVEEAWLNGDISSSDRLRDMLRHNQASGLRFYPVVVDVNKVSNNYSDLIKDNV